MLGKLFKKERPNIYLGKMMVAPASFLTKDDGWGLLGSEDLEAGLRVSLENLIDLPPVYAAYKPAETDLVLEIMVAKHQGGSFNAISVGHHMGVPLFWRPKVVLKARLYNLISGKTIHTFSATKKTPWKQYLFRATRLSSIIGLKPMFGVKDLEVLLFQAVIEVLEKVLKKV